MGLFDLKKELVKLDKDKLVGLILELKWFKLIW
jgi:hypothetical protein